MKRRAFLHLFALLASAGESLASAVRWRQMTAPRAPDPEEAAWDDLTRAIAEDNGAVGEATDYPVRSTSTAGPHSMAWLYGENH